MGIGPDFIALKLNLKKKGGGGAFKRFYLIRQKWPNPILLLENSLMFCKPRSMKSLGTGANAWPAYILNMLIFVWVSEQNPSFKGKFNRFETRNPVLPRGIKKCKLKASHVWRLLLISFQKQEKCCPGQNAWGPRARNCLLSAHSLTMVWGPITTLISYFKCFSFPRFSKMSFYVVPSHIRSQPLAPRGWLLSDTIRDRNHRALQ